MTKDLTIFNYEGASVRVVERNGEPWFIGKDVAEVLGYSNSKDAISAHVDEDDKCLIQRSEITTFEIPNRGMVLINESGLYSLILSSKLHTAKKFKRWVTTEVLPSIRKRGLYATPTTVESILNDPDFGIRLLTELKEERKKNSALSNQIAIQEQQIAEMKPKVSYYDIVLQSPSLIKLSVIAKDYGMAPGAFNKLLYKLKVQYKQGDIWLLYSKYQNEGYTSTSTYAIDNDKSGRQITRCWTKWTQKGRLFLYELLKKNGILPLIERQDDDGGDAA